MQFLKKYTLASLLATSSVLFSAQSFAQNNDLPELGTSALTVLSIEKEKKLGEVIYAEIKGQAGVLHDPLISEYVNALGNRLVAHADDVNFPFTFFTIRSQDINAFAFYGGYIGVHTGLISAADTESQLASVLGHEIAHVTQRHLARRKQASQQQAPLTIAGIVGSLLLAATGNPQAVMASLLATQAGTVQSQLNYTRGNEQEADNIGMNILANAGYDPYAAGEFFGKLQQEFRYKAKIPQFLVSHPLPDSRVTDARLRAQQFEKKFYADSLDFLLIKTRIQARFELDDDRKIPLFEEKVAKARGNKLFAAKYGLALSLVDSKQFKRAKVILDELWQLAPENLYLIDTFSDLYTGMKQPNNALAMLKKAYQYRPNNAVVTLNYANVAIEAKQHKQAIQLLEYYLLRKPSDFLATQLLRLAYKESKNLAKYHGTSAEYYALMSDYRSAIKAADRALAELTENDKAEISRLEALKVKYRARLNYVNEMKRS